jgi:hypothetical protein
VQVQLRCTCKSNGPSCQSHEWSCYSGIATDASHITMAVGIVEVVEVATGVTYEVAVDAVVVNGTTEAIILVVRIAFDAVVEPVTFWIIHVLSVATIEVAGIAIDSGAPGIGTKTIVKEVKLLPKLFAGLQRLLVLKLPNLYEMLLPSLTPALGQH